MQEALTFATLFLILALAGMEPSHAQVTKACYARAVAAVFTLDC